MNSRRNSKTIETKDYRHTSEKRKNVPPAKLADEGKIPKIKKARYYYSPHLTPELRFDPEGKADHVLAIKEKVGEYLSPEEKAVLDNALTNQQPWLEWTEKKEQYDRGWFEVDPVALHIHERVSTQAIIRAAMREDLQRDLFADPELPYQKEVQFYQHDVDWANRLILGDSLQVMSSLARRENLAGKVQMIYIDPPYGIKYSSNFQSEVGIQDFRDKETSLIRELEMIKAYRDTWRLGIHSYLRYIRDRLIISRELLSDSGSIFVQIGDENIHLVRSLIDEIFGRENFISQISFSKTSGFSSRYLSNINDHILWYAKDILSTKYNQLFKLKNIGEEGATKYKPLKSIHPELSLAFDGEKFASSDSITSQGGTSTEQEFIFNGRKYQPPPNQHWKTTVEGIHRLINSCRIKQEGNRPRYVRLLDDFIATPISNVWNDIGGIQNRTEGKLYTVQTASEAIQRCILMATDPGDLVLDPTCGSGTTAMVAEKLGRRWITIDTSRVSIAISRQRLLATQFDYFRVKDENKGIQSGFCNKIVAHISLKSISKNKNLDPIFEKYTDQINTALKKCNEVLSFTSEDTFSKLKTKLIQKEHTEGKRLIAESDYRRWILPSQGKKWEEWEVPFDTDEDWPKDLQNAVVNFRKVWRAKMDEVNACIAANAEQEELVDQPEVAKGIVRVSGPFTVEGIRPEELSLSDEGLFDGTPNEWEQADIADEIQNLSAYLSRMVELIRKDGITFPNNKHQIFGRVDPLYQESTGTPIHAEAIWNDIDTKEANNIGISFGPQYGPVTVEQVAEVIRSGRRYDELIIAGFSFDAAALDALQESQHPKQKIHIAHIRPDVSPGMDGLLKETPNSQLFTVFGQPEIIVHPPKNGEYTVELLGVDIYDPLTGEVRSSKADKVAAWFLDSDYDGRCFCITQAFFPDQNAWEKIAKSLGSQADPDAFAALNGTVSIPFKSGKFNRIAVKVIDPRGNEVIAIAKLEKEAK